MKLEYGKFSHEFASLPEASQLALVSRGLTHLMSNEVSSTVVGRIARNLWPSEDGKGLAKDAPEGADRTAAIKAFRADNAELVKGWTEEEQSATWQELLAGEIGVSTRGPSVDPVESRMKSIARKEVITTLTTHKIKVPKKADDVVKFADGTEKTMGQMVATRLEKFGDRIRKEAEKAIADEARKAKRIADEAKTVGEASAESLGL